MPDSGAVERKMALQRTVVWFERLKAELGADEITVPAAGTEKD